MGSQVQSSLMMITTGSAIFCRVRSVLLSPLQLPKMQVSEPVLVSMLKYRVLTGLSILAPITVEKRPWR